MKKLMNKIEDMLMAVTFAEAGETQTAREIMNNMKKRKIDRYQIRKQKRSVIARHYGRV